MRKAVLFAALATATVAFPGAANAQSFDGTTVDYQYYFPDSTSPYSNADNGPHLVGPGVEVSNVADGVATMDISANNIFIDFLLNTSWTSASFNGWVLSDLTNNLSTITGVTINGSTNMAGFSASNLSWTGDSITVNWQSLAFNPDTVVSLDVSFADSAVPEPSTWAMMLFGFGAVGFAMRRQRRHALAQFA